MTLRSALLIATTVAVQALGPAAALAVGDGTTGVIVRLADPPVVHYRGGIGGLAATSVEPARGRRLDARSRAVTAYRAFLSNRQDAFVAAATLVTPGVQVLHRYQLALNGVALRVPEAAVDGIRSLPGVVAVYPDERFRPTTERSPAFIGATAAWKALGGQAVAGEGIVVGVLDSGIWPEHPSFSDPDPDGKPYPPRPGVRACEFGSGANPGPPFTCNNKLIGAYRFMAAFDACVGAGQCELPAGAFTSARDDDGHGTHTASTAAGNGKVPATIVGIARGKVSGIAPRAHVIAYKVCQAECFQSDSAAAVDQAIADGVDVINFSIGGGTAPYSDPVEIAFLGAYSEGIFVAASAGNDGLAETVNHRGPWVTTVAASTQKRQFASKLTLAGSTGKKLKLNGGTISAGVVPARSVLDAAAVGDPFCENATPDGTFANMVAICNRGVGNRLRKSFNVAQRGAAGMILYDAFFARIFTDNHGIPTLYVPKDAGTALRALLAQHPAATATFQAGKAKGAKGDVMADFSSRGGPRQLLGVSKPDVTAPGVQILAGTTPDTATITDADDQLFQAIQGTSMSSPHVAGAAALVRAIHPSFTPGQIQSTLMTLASPKVFDDDGTTPFDPFDAGSGRVSLKQIASVPITFEAGWIDFAFAPFSGIDLSHLNTPSLYLPNVASTAVVQRTARNVRAKPTTLKLKVEAPADLVVTVPASITMPAGGDATFTVAVDASAVPEREVRHAAIVFSGGGPKLRFPITVRKISTTTTLYGGLGGGSTALPGGVVTLDQAVGGGTVLVDAVTPGWLTGLDFWAGILVGSTNEGGPSRLLGIDPATGGALGSVVLQDDPFFPSPVSIGDLAVQPGTGVIYGIRWNGDRFGAPGWLYTIDPFSGLVFEVGDTGSCSEGGLAFAPDGTLYFAGYTDCTFSRVALRVLDPATAATISSTPLSLVYDGLAVRPTDGTLFASRGDALYEIDPATGVEVFWGRSETGVVADLAFR